MLVVCLAGAVCPAQQEPAPANQVGALTASPSLTALARGQTPAARPSTAKPNLVPPKPGMWAGNSTKFFTGAFAAFAGHESGHLVTNSALNTHLYTMPVHYGPIPFFTIQPGRPLTRHEHYITASAGFSAQHIINEWVLSTHPNLIRENEPTLKGLTSFNFWLSVGYAATAFAKSGPQERDTKGMADALGCNERWVGAMILVPTALDTYRYKHPESKWAPTASRLSKLAIILLAAKAHD